MTKRVLLLSFAIHLALFTWLARQRPVATAADAPPEGITIELETQLAPEPRPLPAPIATSETLASAIVRPSTTPRAPTGGAAIPSGFDAPPNTAPYASNGTLIVFAPDLGLSGIGGSNPFLRNGLNHGATTEGHFVDADPMYVPLEKRAEQSVKDALRARDQSIGLGIEGPVLHALEDATHAGFAPDRGNATFLAVIDERGLVIDLKVISSTASSSTGSRGWEDVRQRAVKSLATARIDLRGVKRAELKIAVESEVLLPSGNKPDDAPMKAPVGGLKPKPMVVETNAPRSPGGSDVVVGTEVAQFDITDIGAKKQRVVHAKLVLITTR